MGRGNKKKQEETRRNKRKQEGRRRKKRKQEERRRKKRKEEGRRGKKKEEEETRGKKKEEEGRRDGDSLFFSSTDFKSSFPYFSLVVERHLEDRVVDVSRFGSIENLFLGGIQVSVKDVVEDGVVEEDNVLRNNSQLFPQTLNGNLSYLFSIYPYLSFSFSQLIKAKQKPEYC